MVGEIPGQTMSQRILIVGKSESGKSSLARRLMAPAIAAGLPVFVRDPLGYTWEGARGYFNDTTELRCLMAEHGTPAVVVIDESVDFFRVGQVENHWIFTRGRHEGLLPISIAHRVKMIAPNVRAQASDLYVFNSAKEDSDILAGDYAHEGLREANTLEQGEFFHLRWKDKKNTLTRHKLF